MLVDVVIVYPIRFQGHQQGIVLLPFKNEFSVFHYSLGF